MVDNSNDIENCANLIYTHFEQRGSSCIRDPSDCEARLKEHSNGFVTVLLGAGASASIGTNGLIRSLIEDHEDMFNINTAVYFGKKLENCTLEELLSIYSQIYDDNKVKKFLTEKKILNRDDNIRPTEGYEFLAHLVRHRLVNNIITTNFDEEPEISLDDEIGRDNYTILKSLSQFDAFNMEIEMKRQRAESEGKIFNEISIIKKPILLKVHGTISYPLTIRATIENVKKFEEQKRKTIEWILCHTTILIIIGYSFRDKDLENAFKEALIRKGRRDHPDKMNIFWVHKTFSNRDKYVNFLDTIYRKKAIRDSIIKPVFFITQNTNDFLRILCEKIEEKDLNTEITTIARQKLRILLLDNSYVFGLNNNEIDNKKLSRFLNKNNSNGLMQPSSIEYDEEESVIIIKSNFGKSYNFKARKEVDKLTIYRESYSNTIIKDKFYIEVILFALTAKGLFGVNALRDCIRIQRYCEELRLIGLSPQNLLQELIESNIINKINASEDIYYLPDDDLPDDDLPERYFYNIADKLIRFFKLDEDKIHDIIAMLKKLDDVFDVDIAEPDVDTYLIFENPEWIPNHKVWGRLTEEFIGNNNINLKIIAQTGEWIKKAIEKEYFRSFFQKDGKIKLIICENFKDAGMHTRRQDAIVRDLTKKYPKNIEIRYLPWGLISEHIKINSCMGMYMKRTAKSSIVAPVLIRDKNDLQLLDSKFENYWTIAKNYGK